MCTDPCSTCIRPHDHSGTCTMAEQCTAALYQARGTCILALAWRVFTRLLHTHTVILCNPDTNYAHECGISVLPSTCHTLTRVARHTPNRDPVEGSHTMKPSHVIWEQCHHAWVVVQPTESHAISHLHDLPWLQQYRTWHNSIGTRFCTRIDISTNNNLKVRT